MAQSLARLGKVIQLIATNPGITLAGLTRDLSKAGFGVTERTIAKDVLALKQEYKLLPARARLRGGYVLNDVPSMSPRDLSVVLDVLQVFASRFGDSEAADVFDRLSVLSGVKGRSHTKAVKHRQIYAANERVQATLLSAIRTRAAVSIEYSTPRLIKPQHLKCFPLLLVFHERGWYCITRDLATKTFYPRRTDRIRRCSILKTTNPAHEQDLIDAEFLMNCGWGMTFPHSMRELRAAEEAPPIVARFDRSVAPYILESLLRHPRGTVASARDGSGDALFKIRLSDPQEFLHWVRSFGAKAYITSPPSIVAKERAEIKRMLERYQE